MTHLDSGVARLSDARLSILGGTGSGNFGHAGRPGEIGGSGEGGAAGSFPTKKRLGENIKKISIGPAPTSIFEKLSPQEETAVINTVLGQSGDHNAALFEAERTAKALVQDANEKFDVSIIPRYAGNVPVLALNYKGENGTVIERALSRNENTGALIVDHAYFSVPEPQQGAGLAKDVLRSSFAEYQRIGVSEVDTLANIDTGRYAWARFGFVPASIGASQRVYSAAAAAMQNEATAKALAPGGSMYFRKELADPALYDETVRQSKSANPNPQHIWKIADSPHGFRYLSGNKLAGDSEHGAWNAKFDLKDSKQIARLSAYLQQPSKKLKAAAAFSADDIKSFVVLDRSGNPLGKPVYTSGEMFFADASGIQQDRELWEEFLGEAFDEPFRAAGDKPGHPFHGNQYSESGDSNAPLEPIDQAPASLCYSNAKAYATAHSAEGAVVVHGTVDSAKHERIAHAWVEIGDTIHDPTAGITTSKARYAKEVNPKIDARYTPEQALINSLRSGNHGPWAAKEVGPRHLGSSKSGNFGHEGRPGEVGGSSSATVSVTALTPDAVQALNVRYEKAEAVESSDAKALEFISTAIDYAQNAPFKDDIRSAFILDKDGQIVAGGFAIISKNGKTAEFSTQGSVVKGGGTAIVNEIHRQLKEAGVKTVTANSLVPEFHKKFGYIDTGKVDFSDEGETSYRLKRTLGGVGSGNFSHAGRPGTVGGSSEGGGSRSQAWFDSLTKIGSARGTNAGGVFKDPNGARWYVKNYSDPNQAASEQISNAVYRAVGAAVPNSVLGPNGQFATTWESGTVLNQHGLDREAANRILDHFAADVLVDNWDAVGTGHDNILVKPDGNVLRVDQGGTLLYRAQGALKPEAGLDKVGEWDSLVNQNTYYKAVFKAAGVAKGDALGSRAVDQINAIVSARPKAGWSELVKREAPVAPKAFVSRVSSMLEARQKGLEAKRDALSARHAGGAGSGNFGHSGRPGEIGGSGGAAGPLQGEAPGEHTPEGQQKLISYLQKETGEVFLPHGSVKRGETSKNDFDLILQQPTEAEAEAAYAKQMDAESELRARVKSGDISEHDAMAQLYGEAAPDPIDVALQKIGFHYEGAVGFDGSPTGTAGDPEVHVVRYVNPTTDHHIEIWIPTAFRSAGGAGSGNFSHAGRKGEIGGSAPAAEVNVGSLAKLNSLLEQAFAKDPWGMKEDTVRALGSKLNDVAVAAGIGVAWPNAQGQALARGAIERWGDTSGDSNPTAVAMQLNIRDEFELKAAAVGHFGAAKVQTDEERAADRGYSRAEYENTQKWLSDHGISDVTVVRGVALPNLTDGVQTVNQQPASSWTADVDKSALFSFGGGQQTADAKNAILIASVPASRILSTSATGRGEATEYEVLMLGGPTKVTAVLRHPDEKASSFIERTQAVLHHAAYSRAAGGAGSGFHGHEGRPGEVGGSSDDGRAEVHQVLSVKDAIPLILAGKTVELKNPKKVNTLLVKLAAITKDAVAKGDAAPNYDACKITVSGSSFFCGSAIKTKEHPNGLPRVVMPQLGGVPRPGSTAAKLPRDAEGRVDAGPEFLDYLASHGISSRSEETRAASLVASQAELNGPAIAKRVAKDSYSPSGPIFISRDGYIVDGHHRWASVVGRDAADTHLGDLKIRVVRLDAPITEVLHLATTWSKKFGLPGVSARGASLHPNELRSVWAETKSFLRKTFTFDNRRSLAAFLSSLFVDSNLVNHHPDVTTENDSATVAYTTHQAGDIVTDSDRECADRTDHLAELVASAPPDMSTRIPDARSAASPHQKNIHVAAATVSPKFKALAQSAFDAGRKTWRASQSVDKTAKTVRGAFEAKLQPILLEGLASGAALASASLGRRNALALPEGQNIHGRFAASASAIKWAKAHAGELIDGIDGTTRENIREAIAATLENELSHADAVSFIANAVGDEARAELIAETEGLTSVLTGQRMEWNDAAASGDLTGNEVRVWITYPGSCPECDDLEGETAELDGTYPGDGEDGPPLHPYCQCTEELREARSARSAGDHPGHEFHGNQWTAGGFGLPPASQDPAPGTRYFYHATSTKNLESIAKTGITGGHSRNPISLSPHLDSVQQWGGMIGEKGQETAILRTPRAGLNIEPHDPSDEYDRNDPTAEDATFTPIHPGRLEVWHGGEWKPLLKARSATRSAGDVSGHPFYGNQWTAGGAVELSKLEAKYGETIPQDAVFPHYDINREAVSIYNNGIDQSRPGSIEDVPLSGLHATQDEIDATGLRHYINGTGRSDAEPIVLRHSGKDYLVEGHHRAGAAILEGKKTIKAEVYDTSKLLGLASRDAGGAGSGNFEHKGRPGEIGGSAEWTTSGSAHEARRAELVLPPAWKHVRINRDPKADLQATGIDVKGRTQYRYSAAHSEAAAAEKFSRLKDFNKELPQIRAKVAADLKDKNAPAHVREAAAVITLIDKTGFRIGSDNETGAAKQAYGASTLLAKHVEIAGSTVTFSFVGKKGVEIEKSVTDPALASMLAPRVAAGGRLFDVSDMQVRDYLHSRDGEFKVKDFRTYHGTAEALRAIKSMPAPSSEKELKAAQKSVGKVVAAHLGNTPAVALASYVDPAVWSSWKSKLMKS